jgi:serine/threonine protein kinase/tetratricopeptide (TPR) repeat protein
MSDSIAGVKSIFGHAMELASPEEREAYLARACGDDPRLRVEVESLLQAAEDAGGFLQAARPADETADESPLAERPGTVIGPYKLLEQIGEGGFGVVYMAEQERPVCRKVALKVLKPGMDTRQVVARFEAERQALALMDHPNIAHIHDGGTTAAGRPYFVMELVRGVPITDYCDQSQLSVPARLELFVRVCQAVQHAHTKGVIHRDLKPSNVLVTLHDGTPVPKVIDFGVAKALGQRLTDKTLFTAFAQMVGTPLYMSPEQAQFSGLDVDTRTDVYSLGVLLYELLSGTTPFDGERMRTVGYDEMRRIIREEEPARPSSRVSTLGQAASTMSLNRRSDPRRLSRLLRGELDWVVMKCLEKERTRRYETVDALAKDVGRYLADEPVQACPPSVRYRVRKLARRHRAGLAVAGLVLTFVVLSGAGAGWVVRDRAARQADANREQAAREADKDREVAQGLSDAARARDGRRWAEARQAVKRVEWLLAGGGRADQRQDLRDLVTDLDMVARLEEIRLQQGDTKVSDFAHADADPAYTGAFRAYGLDLARLDPAAAAERIRASSIRNQLVIGLDDWAWVKLRTDPGGRQRLVDVARRADPDGWRNLLRDAAAEKDRAALAKLAERPEVAQLPPATVVLLARMLAAAGMPRQGVDVLAAAHLRHPDDLWVNFDLSLLLLWRVSPPRPGEALGYARAALALRPHSAGLYVRVGDALQATRLDEAIAAYRKANELQPDYAVAYKALGFALAKKGAWGEAITAYRDGIRRDPRMTHVHVLLAAAYQQTQQWDEAIATLQDAVRLRPDDASAQAALAWNLATHPQPASRDIPQALERSERAVQLAPKNGNAWEARGAAYYRAGDWAGAITAMDKARAVFGPGASTYQFAWLAMAHWRNGDKEQARVWYDRSAQWLEKKLEKANVDPWMNEYDLRRLHAEATQVLGADPPPAKGDGRAPAKAPGSAR